MVFILVRSTPIVTSVYAISDDGPMMMTLAPISREAGTATTHDVCHRLPHASASTASRHFVMVTVVPTPTSETISNSSMRRRVPPSPSPSPRYVL